MKGKLMVITLALTACIGVYLLGDGITGLMIAQSCCFPPDCPADRICDAAKPGLQSPMPLVNAMWGGVLIIGIMAVLYVIYVSKRK